MRRQQIRVTVYRMLGSFAIGIKSAFTRAGSILAMPGWVFSMTFAYAVVCINSGQDGTRKEYQKMKNKGQ